VLIARVHSTILEGLTPRSEQHIPALIMRQFPSFAGAALAFLLVPGSVCAGDPFDLQIKVFRMSSNVGKKISAIKSENLVAKLPTGTPVTTVSIAENAIPKNPNPIEAAKFLVANGADCCQPLEHAHGDWYWCCDKTRLIQIKAQSGSAKAALTEVLAKASKIDDVTWAKLKQKTS
jgi:hypothetical protein